MTNIVYPEVGIYKRKILRKNTLSTEKKVRFKSIRKKENTMTILTKIKKIK